MFGDRSASHNPNEESQSSESSANDSASGAVSGDVAGDVPCDVAGDVAGDVPADVSGDVSGDVPADVPTLVSHIFRRWYTRLVGTLVRAVGSTHLEMVEDAVQDSLLAALQHWPFRGIPEQPDAWLYQVARRKLLDRMGRAQTARRAEPSLTATFASVPSQWRASPPDDSSLGDDELVMLFMCAHPSLNVDAQLTLMLRTVCGLTVAEIASALLTPEATIAQRLVRAKRTLALESEPFLLPTGNALELRLDVVLRAIYLLFTEGYAATRGDAPVRQELCHEAVRLVTALAESPTGGTPRAFALSALLELQSSRLDARERADGTTVPLDEQDRNLWDHPAISRGLSWLSRAAEGEVISDYHIQAAIAAEHAITINQTPTNWARIRLLYEQLLQRTTSPVVRLNHALAVARTDGARPALALLSVLQDEPKLAGNHLLPAMQAMLYSESGQYELAASSTRIALHRARTIADRALLTARLAALAPETADVHEHTFHRTQ